MPWYGKSDWVAPTATPEIEEFIEKVRADLFNNPGKKIWVKDNPERSEREALKNFRNWTKKETTRLLEFRTRVLDWLLIARRGLLRKQERF